MNARLVYSTGGDTTCPGCGWPATDCKCSARSAVQQAAVSKVVAKLRLEKKGRGGKTVTVVYDLPRNDAFLKDLCQALKRMCGTGGTVHENTIELQGDLCDRIRELLLNRGYLVKG